MSAPFGRRIAEVQGSERHGPYVMLRLRDDAALAPRAGQFYMLTALERWGGGEGERPYLPRALSVADAADGELSFLLEAVGPGTSRLAALEAGERAWISGPLGNGFRAAPAPLLVGGGIGIAPLVLAQRELGPCPALLGFRDGAHAAGAALLDDVELATDDGSAGMRGLVTELLARRLDDGPASVLACGPPAMLDAVRALCLQRGVDAQLALESPMACGFGACYGCVVATRDGYARVCVDGPVFDAAVLA